MCDSLIMMTSHRKYIHLIINLTYVRKGESARISAQDKTLQQLEYKIIDAKQ